MNVEYPRPPKSRQVHGKTLGSEWMEKLRESPQPISERNSTGKTSKTEKQTTRDMVFSLKAPRPTPAADESGNYPPATAVCYLYGDERRAVRTFIETNEEYVRFAMSHKNGTALAHHWPNQLFQLLCEEWQFYCEGKDL